MFFNQGYGLTDLLEDIFAKTFKIAENLVTYYMETAQIEES
jgi:hypothetical protein